MVAEANPVGFGAIGCGGRTEGENFNALVGPGAGGFSAVRLLDNPVPVGFAVLNAYFCNTDCNAIVTVFLFTGCIETPWNNEDRAPVEFHVSNHTE